MMTLDEGIRLAEGFFDKFIMVGPRACCCPYSLRYTSLILLYLAGVRGLLRVRELVILYKSVMEVFGPCDSVRLFFSRKTPKTKVISLRASCSEEGV